MSECQCQVCCFSRFVGKQLEKIEDENAKLFFQNLYDLYIETEMDRDYYKAIIDGHWPQADEIIKNRREKLSSSSDIIPERKDECTSK